MRSLSREAGLVCLALCGACAQDSANLEPQPPALTNAAGAAAVSGIAPGAAPATAIGPGTTAPVASAAGEYQELVGLDWTLEPGTERYLCVRKTLPQTLFVTGWRGYSPPGTHHMALTQSADPDGTPDGTEPCDVSTLGTQQVYGTGKGSASRLYPDGIAARLPAGAQLLLNLHLFNVNDTPLSGRTATWYLPTDEKDVKLLADGMVVGPTRLSVPPGRSTSSGRCTFDRDTTLFGIMPHMHQTGVSLSAIAHSALHGDVLLYDGPYDFDNQLSYPMAMLTLAKGDTVDVACTYENPSTRTLVWGESSKDEMCQAGIARIASGGPSVCNH